LITIWSTLPHGHPSLRKCAPAVPLRPRAGRPCHPPARPDLHGHPGRGRWPAARAPADPCRADAENLPIRHHPTARVPESRSSHGPSAVPVPRPTRSPSGTGVSRPAPPHTASGRTPGQSRPLPAGLMRRRGCAVAGVTRASVASHRTQTHCRSCGCDGCDRQYGSGWPADVARRWPAGAAKGCGLLRASRAVTGRRGEGCGRPAGRGCSLPRAAIRCCRGRAGRRGRCQPRRGRYLPAPGLP